MTITVSMEMPKAHSKKQQMIMSSLSIKGLRETWACFGTKFGKTLGGSVAIATPAMRRFNTWWRWVAPENDIALDMGYDNVIKVVPPDPHAKGVRGNGIITLPRVGTKIEFCHGQNPASLEGPGIHGYVFDEAAKMDPQVRSSCRTTLTYTNGPSLYLCYPWGKNWFYDGCMEAKAAMEWAIKNDRQPEKIFLRGRTIDNPAISAQVVANARRELPWRLFRQYYLAEFVDDESVFGGLNSCLFGEPLLHLEGDSQMWFHESAPNCEVVIGADWAKTKDRTVFVARDVRTRRMIGYQRFYKTPYPEAIKRLVRFSRRFKETLDIAHDKTGIGQAIDDQLAHTDLPYRGVTFTNALKAEMVTRLVTSIEHGWVGYPRIPEVISEFKAFEVKVTPSGVVIYSAPSGKHDDIVMADVLCHDALIIHADDGAPDDDHLRAPKKRKDSDPVPDKEEDPIEAFYRDLRDEHEDSMDD